MKKTIKASDAAFYIRSRAGYCEAMSNAGWLMPSLHSAMCTLDFMYSIRLGTHYCPKKVDKRNDRDCHHPPTKEILM